MRYLSPFALVGVYQHLVGEAIDFGAKVDYFPWEQFGFSLRYNYNDIKLDFNKSHFKGGIDIRNSGPQLMATLRF